MPFIEIHVNLIVLLLMVVMSALAGFALRSRQIRNLKLKVIALENEMLQNHAEILTLQKELAKVPKFISGSKTPVVNIKENSGPDEKLASSKSV